LIIDNYQILEKINLNIIRTTTTTTTTTQTTTTNNTTNYNNNTKLDNRKIPTTDRYQNYTTITITVTSQNQLNNNNHQHTTHNHHTTNAKQQQLSNDKYLKHLLYKISFFDFTYFACFSLIFFFILYF